MAAGPVRANQTLTGGGGVMASVSTRKLTIVAQDPSVKINGKILTAEVHVPFEQLEDGPTGYRIKVVDFDSSSGALYKPISAKKYFERGKPVDPFANPSDRTIMTDPRFHAQNVYAVIMRTLARFEFALGRRVKWSFDGHQIHAAPHAFADANAFYAKNERGLLFGYFSGELSNKTVFSCLSHDVVAHETTHALLDGLRERYIYPSSDDQGAFHEGFSDIVALLSIFSIEDMVEHVLGMQEDCIDAKKPGLIHRQCLSEKALKGSVLLSLAEEMGQEMSGVRGRPLRQSAELAPSPEYMKQDEYKEPHRRGEILVAAMMNAFLGVWVSRMGEIGWVEPGYKSLRLVAEEGASAAEHLLTMSIRALDYCPATDLLFGDFLSGLLTADREMYPDDRRFGYRKVLLKSFVGFGIKPESKGTASDPGIWDRPSPEKPLDYSAIHFEFLQRDRDEVFRFIWENRKALGICEDAYTRVLTVLPCQRVAVDGFALRETVAQYVQMMTLQAQELGRYDIVPPEGMSAARQVTLYGGGALIFDEFGHLKYHVHNSILDPVRQTKRLQSLFGRGYFGEDRSARGDFAEIHRRRQLNATAEREEGTW
jgi:hypothetical protein